MKVSIMYVRTDYEGETHEDTIMYNPWPFDWLPQMGNEISFGPMMHSFTVTFVSFTPQDGDGRDNPSIFIIAEIK